MKRDEMIPAIEDIEIGAREAELLLDSPTERVVFVNRKMPVEWMTPTQAGAVLGRAVRKGLPFTRQHMIRQIRLGKLDSYETPLGRIIHVRDLVEYVRRYYQKRIQKIRQREENKQNGKPWWWKPGMPEPDPDTGRIFDRGVESRLLDVLGDQLDREPGG